MTRPTAAGAGAAGGVAGAAGGAASAGGRRGPMMGGPGRMMAFGQPGEKPKDLRGSGLRLIGLLRPQRWTAIAVLGCGIASVGLTVLGPKILGHATDLVFAGVIGQRLPAGLTKAEAVARLRAQGQNRFADLLGAMPVVPGQGIDFTAVGRVLLWVLVVYLCASIFGLLQGRLLTRMVQTTVYGLREQVETKLSRLPLSYFDGQPRGEILSRATNDTDNIAQTLQQTLSQLVTALLTVVGVLAVMFWISPVLAAIALVTIPVSIVVTAAIARRSRPQFVKQWATTGKLNGHIEEVFTGHSVVKAFGRQREAAQVFKEHNDQLWGSSFKAQFISGTIQPAMMLMGNLNYVLVAVVGGLFVANGSLSLGDVQAFIQYSRQFSQPVTQVAAMANLLQSGVASAERVFQLLDEPEQSPDPEPAAVPLPSQRGPESEVAGLVAFEDVSFRYKPDQPLIEHLSLTVQPGQTVAIVGPTGAGKTTLVNLLMRFYEVTGGRITLDGVDIATMSRERLRANIGMVLQDTWLFGGSIAQNIGYGADDPTQRDIHAAAEAAHVDRFVRTLPGGYETLLDEDGTGLSAGEKQLVTIARAFLADPAILVLDEATSSVDTRTEVLIQRAMSRLRAGRTSFVIAHRLSTIRDADLILVMEAGSIVEQGTHEQLLEADGAYSRLYRAQFAQPVAELD